MPSENQNRSSGDPKERVLFAATLGLFTFVITPLLAVFLAFPFSFLVKASENLHPVAIISWLLGLQSLGGFFAAQAIVGALLNLAGDAATAFLSWFIYRSKKLAVITFASALIFQVVEIAIVLPIRLRKAQSFAKKGIESEKSYEQFAKIGDVSFEVLDPYSDNTIGNSHPEHGPKYKILRIKVPISVSRAGAYQVNARYSFSRAGETGGTPMKAATQTLEIGKDTVTIEFAANEGSGYGYWSPSLVGGSAEIRLSYLASQKELLDRLKLDPAEDRETLKQFMKDEGLNSRKASLNPTIYKFVERKMISF